MNISLTTPIALVGLISVPIILALHLLRSRAQVYPVSSLSLWRFLNPQLSGTSARKLPLTWLLLTDLLIAILLTLALTGPRIDRTRTIREGRHLVLILDNSTSMAADDLSPTRFDAARRDLVNLARSTIETDAVTVIGFSSTAETLADSRSADFIIQLDALEASLPGGRGANLAAALSLAAASLDPELPGEVHIYTDAAYDPTEPLDTIFPIEWHLYGETGNNQAILNVAAERLSSLKYQVFVRIANFSSEAAERRLVLRADGDRIEAVDLRLDAGASSTYTWEIIGAAEALDVALEGKDDQPQDDTGVATIMDSTGEVNPVRIALVSETPSVLQRALEAVPGTDLSIIQPEDYLAGSPYDLVFFQRYLPERWPGNLAVVIDPPEESGLLGRITSRPITGVPFPQPDSLLAEVDFTGVRWQTVSLPDRIPEGIEAILSNQDTPIILRGQTGVTRLVLLLSSINDESGTPSALARHPAFPLLIANIVEDARDVQLPPDLIVGSPIPLPASSQYPSIQIRQPDGALTEFGSRRPILWRDTLQPGLYEFILTDLDGNTAMYSIGVNAGDIYESDILPRDWPSIFESPPLPTATSEQPISLVPYLLAAVVILLIVEAWFAWR